MGVARTLLMAVGGALAILFSLYSSPQQTHRLRGIFFFEIGKGREEDNSKDAADNMGEKKEGVERRWR